MRSYHRNHTFPFSTQIIILFFYSSVAFADEFFISYNYFVHNAIVKSQNLSISRAMQKCQGSPQDTIFLPANNKKNSITIIKNNEEVFIEFLHTLGMTVTYNDTLQHSLIDTTTTMIFKTQCFSIEKYQDSLKISLLK